MYHRYHYLFYVFKDFMYLNIIIILEFLFGSYILLGFTLGM